MAARRRGRVFWAGSRASGRQYSCAEDAREAHPDNPSGREGNRRGYEGRHPAVDATQSGAVSVTRIRTPSSSRSSCGGVRADPGLQLLDPLPEQRRRRTFPRLPLVDDGLPGGADHARESRLADVEASAQRCELHVIVLGNGGPGQWPWRGGRAALRAVVVPTKVPRVLQRRLRSQTAEGRPRISSRVSVAAASAGNVRGSVEPTAFEGSDGLLCYVNPDNKRASRCRHARAFNSAWIYTSDSCIAPLRSRIH